MAVGRRPVVVGVVVVLVAAGLTAPVRAGCGDSGLCCAGRNSDCVVQNYPLNAIVEDLSKAGRCYCDEFCSQLSDCCDDYRRVCQARDCEVTSWSPWQQPCSAACGLGTTKRYRRIARPPGNGGAKCPGLTERRTCVGTRCEDAKIREIAMILPALYGGYRRVNKTFDVRQNLKQKYHKSKEIQRKNYCITFEVTKSHDLCQVESYTAWTDELEKGATVCVECQPGAMRKYPGGVERCKGDGVSGRQTRWRAIGMSGCHGRWTQRTTKEDCSCGRTNRDRYTNFILL